MIQNSFDLRFSRVLFLFVIVIVSCSSPTENLNEEVNLPIKFTTELITDGLEYPWQISFVGEDRLFITEIEGSVREIESGELKEEPWFELEDYLNEEGIVLPGNSNERRAGLQGIAVDPDFDTNGYVYIGFAYHTDEYNYDLNRLIRLKEDSETGKGVFDKILLDEVPGDDLHQTAQLKFGPDNKLYWSVGDRFEVNSAQDLQDLSGKILRLNPDGSVPIDNPFPNSYIYSYGHRNPQGFAWHKSSGTMLATEHGPSSSQGCCHDEINQILPGKNYGWPKIRGDETSPGMETPLIHSGVAEEGESELDYTWAPSGATFVNFGPWEDSFMFAGLRSKTLWRLTFENGVVHELTPIITNKTHDYHRVRSIEESPDGSLYMITSNKDRTYDPSLGRGDYLIKINVFYDED